MIWYLKALIIFLFSVIFGFLTGDKVFILTLFYVNLSRLTLSMGTLMGDDTIFASDSFFTPWNILSVRLNSVEWLLMQFFCILLLISRILRYLFSSLMVLWSVYLWKLGLEFSVEYDLTEYPENGSWWVAFFDRGRLLIVAYLQRLIK